MLRRRYEKKSTYHGHGHSHRRIKQITKIRVRSTKCRPQNKIRIQRGEFNVGEEKTNGNGEESMKCGKEDTKSKSTYLN